MSVDKFNTPTHCTHTPVLSLHCYRHVSLYVLLLPSCLGLIFRLDTLALSVIATATWLAGWLGGWLSHSGIVSNRLNLSANFFDHLKAPSF